MMQTSVWAIEGSLEQVVGQRVYLLCRPMLGQYELDAVEAMTDVGSCNWQLDM